MRKASNPEKNQWLPSTEGRLAARFKAQTHLAAPDWDNKSSPVNPEKQAEVFILALAERQFEMAGKFRALSCWKWQRSLGTLPLTVV